MSDWDGVCLVWCEVCLVRCEVCLVRCEVCLKRCEVYLVRHGVCHFCPYLSCLAASRVGLVMAETGNRREDMRFSWEAYLERRGAGQKTVRVRCC